MRSCGKPIGAAAGPIASQHNDFPGCDLLIANIALAPKVRLATRNLRDFERVPGLRAENWAD